MEDAKERHDVPEQVTIEDDDHEKTMEEGNELRELENVKELLGAENESYKKEIEKLTAEIEEINISVLSAGELRASYEERRKEYYGNIEKLKSENESLIGDISNIKLKIKADRDDEEAVLSLRDSLIDELNNMKNEKDLIVRRLDDLKKGIREICTDEERNLPHLKEYDEMLKKAYNVFKEVENRMEVSLKLRQKGNY
ncbi:MAG: hypothetical protein JRF30_03335 [Deltaproteobacteria bacterium]|nr:hypothetical protein [Deltaproteobacteria bacterium]MBW1794577.1 hypothetical protein [Deltaproteobacteria bacterium]MBW2329970.1 hypothetical protein [Deltaproteobacteria bacterium]